MSDEKLKKNDLIESVYLNTKIEKHEIQVIFDSLLEQLKLSLENGKTIELRGFGTFEKRLRKGRSNARNPKTGEKVQTQSHYVICLKPGQELRDNIKKLKVID